MPSLGIRITQALYDRLQDRALDESLTVSDLVRQTLSRALDENPDSSNTVSRQELTRLEAQAAEKDKQIAELHQLLGMSQTHADEMRKELSTSHRLLEDARKPKPRRWLFWRQT